MSTKIRSHSYLVLLLALILISSCTTISPHPTEKDSKLIDSGKKSLVLIGLTAIWNNKNIDPVNLFHMDDGDLWGRLAVANLKQRTRLERVRTYIASPPDPSGRRWLYLVLDPGLYYVWGVPPTLYLRDVDFAPRDVKGFFLHVPAGEHVVYAGTLCLDTSGDRFLAQKSIGRIRSYMRDEREDAAQFAHRTYADWPEMAVSLMQPYGAPDASVPGVFPTLLATEANSGGVQSPDWVKRSLRKWTLTEGSSAPSGGLEMPPDAAALIAMTYLAYLPVGAVVGSMLGHADERKWVPCVENLQAEVIRRDLPGELQRSLAATLKDRVIVQGNGGPISADDEHPTDGGSCSSCSTMLSANVERIQLRECNSGLFAVEVATRVKMFDPQKHAYVFYRTALYTNPQAIPLPGEVESTIHWMMPLPFPPPYEFTLPAVSIARPMKDYCGPGGKEIFIQEIMRGIEMATEDFATALGLPAQSNGAEATATP